METYHAFMIDERGTIRSIRKVECADDMTAISACRQILHELPNFSGTEIWSGRQRRVAFIAR